MIWIQGDCFGKFNGNPLQSILVIGKIKDGIIYYFNIGDTTIDICCNTNPCHIIMSVFLLVEEEIKVSVFIKGE
jgi:hypothetical protein